MFLILLKKYNLYNLMYPLYVDNFGIYSNATKYIHKHTPVFSYQVVKVIWNGPTRIKIGVQIFFCSNEMGWRSHEQLSLFPPLPSSSGDDITITQRTKNNFFWKNEYTFFREIKFKILFASQYQRILWLNNHHQSMQTLFPQRI